MRKNNLMLCCSLVIAALALSPAQAETGQAEATASICFEGSSTLHGFEGTVKTKPFHASFSEDEASGQMRVTGTASFNVLDMTTDHKKRDKKMFKMFEQSRFGTITGTLTDAKLPSDENCTSTLRLKIRDIEQEIPVTLHDWKREGDLGTFNMTFSVSLKAFNLKAPSVMGLIRVGDTVNIECAVLASLNPQLDGK
jgi:polyisoprenoid-binding protein YceI